MDRGDSDCQFVCDYARAVVCVEGTVDIEALMCSTIDSFPPIPFPVPLHGVSWALHRTAQANHRVLFFAAPTAPTSEQTRARKCTSHAGVRLATLDDFLAQCLHEVLVVL
eukprot:57854-Rhodomonas_salina.2